MSKLFIGKGIDAGHFLLAIKQSQILHDRAMHKPVVKALSTTDVRLL
jgi:hypothetical protein